MPGLQDSGIRLQSQNPERLCEDMDSQSALPRRRRRAVNTLLTACDYK
jgi:hypothetical protein